MTDQNRLVRKTLLLFSFVCIVMHCAGIGVEASPTLAGLKFTGLSIKTTKTILLFICAYYLLYYTWLSMNNVSEWRIRLTCTKKYYNDTTVVYDRVTDTPEDPRQSTLNHYVLKYLEPLCQDIMTLQASKGADKDPNSSQPDLNNQLNQTLNKILEILNENRITVSLHRFDNWCAFLHKSQNWRWLVCEIILPISMGLAATGFLALEIF